MHAGRGQALAVCAACVRAFVRACVCMRARVRAFWGVGVGIECVGACMLCLQRRLKDGRRALRMQQVHSLI